MIISGMSGNEIYCLSLKGFAPGEVVVGEGLSAGEQVVTEGTLRLRPGAAVSPAATAAPPASSAAIIGWFGSRSPALS